ncbi:hypothetical protein DF16_orf02950 [Bacillus thuringiensis serovar kurstaki str. YBT-1520]|nr:hypothetical protein HD73_3281 [Bacillus thuringiensis serovar kurstaki str. HD73]AIM31365.1 hypothetical protein DF16_orf02950 [Bacillus thuringiensis serovar kurstaki str. YBT-1520]EEL64840.1 hypothetical protein bcere0025_23880 [Bacillus cereus F65185]EEM53225.1 hypothetical protein bthur0006_24380 [Bacillus thuringiensis serovar kurstaki str. T03a001]KEH47169.1 hypothetical protein BG09_4080 [Bacillus thuringiensis serovar kurstaki str. HD-1]QDD83971.1 hypothetical protein FORC087_2674 
MNIYFRYLLEGETEMNFNIKKASEIIECTSQTLEFFANLVND